MLSVPPVTTGTLTVNRAEVLQGIRAMEGPSASEMLPLLEVIMTETKFAMVSDWMSNGSSNEFVEARQDANRFELVSPPLKLLMSSIIVDDSVTLVVGRCHEWLDPYA